jgi:hypothetical protein
LTRRAILGLIASGNGGGFTIGVGAETRPIINVQAVRTRLGVPADLASCRAAAILGLHHRGHVPAQAIMRPLAKNPDTLGLAVPGNAHRWPGMEGGTPEVDDVILFCKHPPLIFGCFIGDQSV